VTFLVLFGRPVLSERLEPVFLQGAERELEDLLTRIGTTGRPIDFTHLVEIARVSTNVSTYQKVPNDTRLSRL